MFLRAQLHQFVSWSKTVNPIYMENKWANYEIEDINKKGDVTPIGQWS